MFDLFEREDYCNDTDAFSETRKLHAPTYHINYDNAINCTDGCPFVVRISGCDFKVVLQYLDKNDEYIHNCFIETTKDLVERYGAQSGWTMGDNILLFFDFEQHDNSWIIFDTENMISTMNSYATIRFDKYINASIDDIILKYNTEIAADLLEQDYVFRSTCILCCASEETLEYIDYIIWRCTEHLDQKCKYFGTIVKPCEFWNSEDPDLDLESGYAYKHVTENVANEIFTVEYINQPSILIIDSNEEDED